MGELVPDKRKDPNKEAFVQMLFRQGVCLGFEWDGVVKKCGKPLREVEGYAYDHAKALQFGGTNDPENFQALCNECHSIKSSLETSRRVKADSQSGGRGSQYARRKKRGGSSIQSKPDSWNKEYKAEIGFKHQWPKRKFGQ